MAKNLTTPLFFWCVLLLVLNFTAAKLACAQISFPNSYGGFLPGSLDIADYDKDGNLDIVVANANNTGAIIRPKVYHNDGNGSFLIIDDEYTQLPSVQTGSTVGWVDYDNDGWPDIILFGRESSGSFKSSLFHNNKNGTFTKFLASFPGIERLDQGSATWADFDKDNLPDLLICGQTGAIGGSSSRIYRNVGNGQFTDIGAGINSVIACAAAWVDYDNDGFLDAFVTGTAYDGTSVSQLYRNNQDSSFTAVPTSIPGVSNGAISWADYNRDGFPDLLIAGTISPSNEPFTRVFRNNGNGTFTDIDARLTPLGNYSGAAWGDFDGDGYADLVIKGSSDGGYVIKVYRNTHDGSFVNIYVSLPAPLGTLRVIDFNQDGALDLVNIGRWDPSTILLNGSRYSISGAITNASFPFSNVVVEILGDAGGSTVAGSDGTYRFIGLTSGHYVIKPVNAPPFVFSPQMRVLDIIASSKQNIDFVALNPNACPSGSLKTSPGVCGCSVPDIDSDGDGVLDCLDSCPNDPHKIASGVCGCGVADTDSDLDGARDCQDVCLNDSHKVTPGICGCGVPDTDSDGDGVLDCLDSCPNDPHKIASGVCGCGVADTDSNGNGVLDCLPNADFVASINLLYKATKALNIKAAAQQKTLRNQIVNQIKALQEVVSKATISSIQLTSTKYKSLKADTNSAVKYLRKVIKDTSAAALKVDQKSAIGYLNKISRNLKKA